MTESSVLPRIPSSFQRDLERVIYERGVHRHFHHLLDGEGYVSLRTPSTLTIDSYDGPWMRPYECTRWDWRPLSDLQRLKLLIDRAVILSEQLQAVKEDRRIQSEALQGDVRSLRARVEQVEMVYEEARNRVVLSVEAIEYATKRIADVMSFSKQLFESFLLQEGQLQIDGKQSYESFEDAEGWRGLNDKRKLERAHMVLMDAFIDALQSLSSSRQQLMSLQEASQEANTSYFEAQLRYATHSPMVALAQTVMKEMKQHSSEALRALLSTYSMPRKHPIVLSLAANSSSSTQPLLSSATMESGLPSTERFSSARRLQRVPWGLVFVRDPLERLRKEYRAGMAVLQRKIINLKPTYGTYCAVEVMRR